MTAQIAHPGDTFVGILGLVVALVWCLAYCIARAAGNVQATEERWDEQAAADHGEPSRAQVEAAWTAAEIIDDETADVCFDAQLAALGIDREDLAAAFNTLRFQQRIDRIRDQIHENEVDRFRRDIDAWVGGDVA